MTRSRICLSLALMLVAGVHAADWPHWRGPNRDGTTSEESGWERGAWPPRELWRTSVGIGSTSSLIVDGRLYTMGWANNTDSVVCVDVRNGKELWRVSYPCPKFGRNAAGDQSLYAGPTSTPELDKETGYLYTLSTDGDLACWDTRKRGATVWGLNLYERYRMPRRPAVNKSGRRDYGYTTAPLVYGDMVLIEAGGTAGTVVAFDKRNGRQRWASQAKGLAGHTGAPALMEVQGVPCLAALTFDGLLVMRLDEGREGETVANYPYQTDFANSIASPAALGNEVLITSGYNHMTMMKLRIGLDGATEMWTRKQILSKVCTPVFLNGRAYWSWNYAHCLNVADGRLLWKGRSGGTDGSCIITADKRLIVLANRGEVLLMETAERSPDQCRILSRAGRLFRKEVWPHIALSDGKLYCKDRGGNIACLSLLSPPEAATAVAAKSGTTQPAGGAVGDGGPIVEWRAGMGRSAAGPAEAALELRPRGSAQTRTDGALAVTGGAFLIDGANGPLLSQCRASGELTLEVGLRADTLRQGGPARIVSFSADPYRRNFTLGQQDDRLLLRLRTPQTGENGMKPETTLCKVREAAEHHVVVTYRDGELVCYLDGQVAMRSGAVRGRFDNWEPMHLLLGDEYEGSRDWQGSFTRLAILGRAIGPEEAKQRFEDARKGVLPGAGSRAPAAPGRPRTTPAPNGPRSETPTAAIKLTELADWQGQESFGIETPAGAFVFHRRGGGFASLIDRDGHDWISFRPGGGPAGSYRGIPNLPIPKGGFHPGATTCETKVLEVGSGKVIIECRTTDGGWAGRWTIIREAAVLDLTEAAGSYWFLYEGTPGGQYDESKAWMMDSSGRREPCTSRWERRLPDPRWICFGTAGSTRVLFLADLTPRPADVVDSFWSMGKGMTVFGFGRQLSRKDGRWHHLRRVPARLAVGLVEATDHKGISQHIERVCGSLPL